MATVAELMAVISADTHDFDAGLDRMSEGLRSVNDQLYDFGSAAMQLSAPLVGAFSLAYNQFLNFDTAMTNVQAVTGRTNEEMAALQETLLGLESVYGPTTLATTFYDVVGGVTDVNAQMPVFEAALLTAEATASDLQATTQALIASINSYGMETLDASAAADIMVLAVNRGVGTMAELAAALPEVAGLAASLDIEFGELAGALAFMTTKGFSFSQSGTQVRAVMTALLNPNERLAEAFENLGIASGQVLLEQYGLIGAMELLGQNIPQAEMAAMLGSTEALSAYLALSTEQSQTFVANFAGNMTAAQNAMAAFLEETEGMAAAQAYIDSLGLSLENVAEQSAAIQRDSPGAQWALAKAEIEKLAITIGDILAPSISQAMEDVRPMVAVFREFAENNPQLVSTLALVSFGLFGVGLAASGASLAIGGLGATAALALSPLGLLALAVVGLGLAYQADLHGFKTNIDELREALQDGDVARAVRELGEAFGSLTGAGAEALGEVLGIDVIAGLQAWEEAWDNFVLIIDLVNAKIDLALVNLALTIAAGLNEVLAPIQELGQSDFANDLGLSFDLGLIDTASLEQQKAELLATLGQTAALEMEVEVTLNPDLTQLDTGELALLMNEMGGLAIDVSINRETYGEALIQLEHLEASTAAPLVFVIGDETYVGFRAARDALDQAILNSDGKAINIQISTNASAVEDEIERLIQQRTMRIQIEAGLSGALGFGGGRAAGGPVKADQWYVVGEHGPEIFAPGTSGTVIPAPAAAPGLAGSGLSFNIQTLIVSGVQNVGELYDALVGEARARGSGGFVMAGTL